MGDLPGRLSLKQLTVTSLMTIETLQISARLWFQKTIRQTKDSRELMSTVYHKMPKDLEGKSVH